MKKTLEDLKQLLGSGRSSARSLVEQAKADYDRVGDEHLFTLPMWAEALAEADRIDRQRAAGDEVSEYAGIPITVKDLFDLEGQVTTAGSRALADKPVASSSAPSIQRLIDYGFIVIGKVNMTEFAYSGLGLNPHFGTPVNPCSDKTPRIPGGSSSGGAVSVASGLVSASIGSDTGGSVRIPSSLCGLTGFKPGSESVSRDGAIPLSTTLDSIGPLCNSVQCCADLHNIMSGGSLVRLERKSIDGLRLLVPENVVWDGCDTGVASRANSYLDELVSCGCKIERRSLKLLDDILESGAQGWIAGYESHQWHRELIETKATLYDPRVLVRITNGATIPEQQYRSALAQIAAFRAEFEELMQGYDLLCYPTTALVAPTFSELEADNEYGRINLMMLRNTALGNVLNAASISMPMPESASGKSSIGDLLPAGIMFSRPAGDEADVLDAAYSIEQQTAVVRT